MRRSSTLLAVALCLAPAFTPLMAQQVQIAAPLAGSTTIDFNTLSQAEVISNQFAGVSVSNGLCANDDYSFHDNTMAATNFLNFTSAPCNGLQGAPITFVFANAIQSFGFIAVTNGGAITFTNPNGSINVGLTQSGFNGFSDAAAFSSVTVSVAGDGYFFMDDVSYAASASTVPEPASIVLLATGLLGVAGVARRRRA